MVRAQLDLAHCTTGQYSGDRFFFMVQRRARKRVARLAAALREPHKMDKKMAISAILVARVFNSIAAMAVALIRP